MKARLWILATAGALMPFVGLFGTVLGVMSSFEAIGETGQGGFAVVSVGISQALVATAVGIAVALEGVVHAGRATCSSSERGRLPSPPPAP